MGNCDIKKQVIKRSYLNSAQKLPGNNQIDLVKTKCSLSPEFKKNV